MKYVALAPKWNRVGLLTPFSLCKMKSPNSLAYTMIYWVRKQEYLHFWDRHRQLVSWEAKHKGMPGFLHVQTFDCLSHCLCEVCPPCLHHCLGELAGKAVSVCRIDHWGRTWPRGQHHWDWKVSSIFWIIWLMWHKYGSLLPKLLSRTGPNSSSILNSNITR